MSSKDGKGKVTIAVSGLNATDNPGPGVPVIRALRLAMGESLEVVGLAYDVMDPGIYMDGIADHVFMVPYPSQGDDILFERLSYIHSRVHLDAIVPTLDAELFPYVRLVPKLEKLGIGTFLPTEEQLKLRSKVEFDKLAQRFDIAVPRSTPITDLNELNRLVASGAYSYPLMVKGQFYDAYVARTQPEAAMYFNKIAAAWGLPVVVQEFLVGEEYDVVALGDGNGGLVGAVPMRKTVLTEKGKAWAGITVGDPKLKELTEKAVRALSWRGPLELEVMKTARSGDYFLLEINPRFPAWCYLAAGAGANLPHACASLALGENVEPFDRYDVGVMFVRHSLDLVRPLYDLEALSTAGEVHRE
ncbi:MAG: biotin carboxylase [Deltaproteobacteria bacterium]|nr:biotin carboxylase [Deltaproteobacteria bacterium]